MSTTEPSYDGVVILGFPRSGTTLLRRLLNAHPALCCPPETNVLNACGRFLTEHDIARGMKVGPIAGLAYSGIDEADLLGRLRDLAFGLFRDIRDRAGKAIWVEKSPFDVFHLDSVERICADRCRYVCIVRHPLDVVCSTKELCDEMEVFPYELHEYVRRYPAQLEAFAHAWADTHERLLSFEAAHRAGCVRVRYEDLVADAPAELARLLDFLGQPTDTAALVGQAMKSKDVVGLGDWKTYQKPAITGGSMERWRQLSEPTLARLAPIVTAVAQQLGYAPIQVAASGDDEQARRQHQIRMMVAKLKGQISKPEPDN